MPPLLPPTQKRGIKLTGLHWRLSWGLGRCPRAGERKASVGLGPSGGQRLWQLRSGLEQWLPHGGAGLAVPARCRARPGSPHGHGLGRCWQKSAGTGTRAGALGRRRAEAGCPPHRKRSTAREEGQSEADPARRDKHSVDQRPGRIRYNLCPTQGGRRMYPFSDEEDWAQRSHPARVTEEEHGFKPESLCRPPGLAV